MRKLLALGSLPLGRIRQIVVVSVISVSALFGGLDQVEKHSSDTVKLVAGKAYTGNQLKVTPLRAQLVNRGPGLPAAPKGKSYLGLVLKVENRSNEPAVGLDSVAAPLGAAGKKPRAVQVVLLRDMTFAPVLQPKLPDEIELFWIVPDTVKPGSKVAFRIADRQLHADTAVGFRNMWVDIEKHGEITMTLESGAVR